MQPRDRRFEIALGLPRALGRGDKIDLYPHIGRVALRSTRFRALARAMSDALGAVGSAILAAMLLIVTANIVLRYVFNAPIGWADQVMAYGLVYVTFLGAPFALAQRAHVSVDILFATSSSACLNWGPTLKTKRPLLQSPAQYWDDPCFGCDGASS